MSTDVDFRDPAATTSAIADAAPDIVLHLAARAGGIGANMAAPADLYLENLLLGTNVIEAARYAGVEKTVVVGTICSYPKYTPVPFQETSLWTGYPEETNAPYGIAKLALLVHLQANRAQYGQGGAYVMPTNLYGPGDKFHPMSATSSPPSSASACSPRKPATPRSRCGAPAVQVGSSCTSTTPLMASSEPPSSTTATNRSTSAPIANC